ncbi:TBC1 domain family member 7 [Dermatophagoides pteronyssinus]|uniref:TBC1 domain family member 7 n=1 Tax=Dermatophagoides pteronyssinus TaxID=6956 RepID=UPI003F6764F5
MSSNDDRNFRYGYYEKVGFGGIEEKKSLEILLRENPPDLLSRLAQLASRYSLSSGQRKQVWQLLLDVIRPDNRITEFRCQVRRKIVMDIIHALTVMGLINDPVIDNRMLAQRINIEDHPRMIVLIFLLETRQLASTINIAHQLQKMDTCDLLVLSEVFAKEFVHTNSPMSSPYTFEDAYWIYKHFMLIINSNLGTLIETYEKFIQYLSHEDNALHNHLVENGIIKQQTDNNGGTNNNSNSNQFFHNNHQQQQLPTTGNQQTPLMMSPQPSSTTLQNQSNSSSSSSWICRQNLINRKKVNEFRPMITWFVRFFAGIIHQNFVIRVLDKVIGCLINGSRPFYVLISISKALIFYQRKQLLLLNNTEQLRHQLLTPLSFEESEKIFSRALNN